MGPPSTLRSRSLAALVVTVALLPACGNASTQAGATSAFLDTARLAAAATSTLDAPASAGRSLYVAPNGSNRAPGTSARPLRTIRAALLRSAPGTTILLRAGTYGSTTDVNVSGSADAPIVIRAYPDERVRITGELRINASHIVVNGFELAGRTKANPRSVLVQIVGSFVTLAHCELHDAAMSGVIVSDGTGVRIVGNWIHDNGTHVLNGVPQDHGIYWSGGRRGLIANNVIEHNVGYGIQLYPRARSTLVTSNTIVGNGSDHAPAAGIILGGEETTGNTVVNNILVDNAETAVRSLQPLGRRNYVTHNLGYGNGSGNFPEAGYGIGLRYIQNQSADPQFADAHAHDYRPATSGPASNSAVARLSPTTDFAGAPRVGAGAPTLGALQAK